MSCRIRFGVELGKQRKLIKASVTLSATTDLLPHHEAPMKTIKRVLVVFTTFIAVGLLTVAYLVSTTELEFRSILPHAPEMPKPKMTLPPFAALRAFHAAATHDRYRDAAESLGLTESAISHQVRRLEKFLRTPLIDRSGRRPKLTETGRRYLEQIEPAMRQIHAATEALPVPEPWRWRGRCCRRIVWQ